MEDLVGMMLSGVPGKILTWSKCPCLTSLETWVSHLGMQIPRRQVSVEPSHQPSTPLVKQASRTRSSSSKSIRPLQIHGEVELEFWRYVSSLLLN